MGWAGGSRVFGEIIELLVEKVEDESIRKEIYAGLIEIFEETADCDTLYECQGDDEVFDELWQELYPDDDDYD